MVELSIEELTKLKPEAALDLAKDNLRKEGHDKSAIKNIVLKYAEEDPKLTIEKFKLPSDKKGEYLTSAVQHEMININLAVAQVMFDKGETALSLKALQSAMTYNGQSSTKQTAMELTAKMLEKDPEGSFEIVASGFSHADASSWEGRSKRHQDPKFNGEDNHLRSGCAELGVRIAKITEKTDPELSLRVIQSLEDHKLDDISKDLAKRAAAIYKTIAKDNPQLVLAEMTDQSATRIINADSKELLYARYEVLNEQIKQDPKKLTIMSDLLKSTPFPLPDRKNNFNPSKTDVYVTVASKLEKVSSNDPELAAQVIMDLHSCNEHVAPFYDKAASNATKQIGAVVSKMLNSAPPTMEYTKEHELAVDIIREGFKGSYNKELIKEYSGILVEFAKKNVSHAKHMLESGSKNGNDYARPICKEALAEISPATQTTVEGGGAIPAKAQLGPDVHRV